ncbi:hypothetical protein NQ176_g2467 [Zarea fungicola]|uniref:Uncharacterized protein n=1 Tax=Zarea fungicola TaxID=93591 RepID=A0ACC1NN12_9HYPO|nr:hypothetical protein NQ176_g2467 [Lecanicillium fungicola]
MLSIFVATTITLWVSLHTAHALSFQQKCESFVLRHGTAILSNATFISPGGYTTTLYNITSTNKIAFCRISAAQPYPTNNRVQFEVWLPDPNVYNDRFLVLGNGGMAGILDETSLMSCLNQNFACATGDSGHRAKDNNDGNGAPGVYLPYLHDREQTLAWIHNSIALLTAPAKKIVRTMYGRRPKYSYYQGCSTGGAQGFSLAQFHPHLFDGIVAGSPGNWYSHLVLSFLWNTVPESVNSPPGAPDFSLSDLNLITTAALKKCDAIDGVADGLIENPLQCHFDIDNLQCPPSQASSAAASCLSAQKIQQAKKIYDGPKRPASNLAVYPGFSVGSESSWAMQEQGLSSAFSIPILQNLVFNNLAYNVSTFNWGTDVDLVDKRSGRLMDAISSDLSSFRATGAKMVVTQGWADPFNAALWPIQHREQLQNTMRGNVDDWFSLFMVPGGGHCGAAPGYPHVPANWHSLDVLIDWVEGGKKPKAMLSSDVHNWESYTCQ